MIRARCPQHRKTAAKGYGGAHQRIRGDAIHAHPWCEQCGHGADPDTGRCSDPTSTQEALIRSSPQGYRSYLDFLHLPLGEFPRVEVTQGGVAYPDPTGNRLVVAEGLANDADAALHEYTHWVLEESVDSPRADWQPGLRAIQAGLAYYLPRSFANTPGLGFLDILRPNPALAIGEDHRVGSGWRGRCGG